MSIASQISRINGNIAAAYTVCSDKGATIPQTQNSANLADTIDSIQQGIGSVERKALNLYDWEGTLLASYTNAEAQALSALPPTSGVTHDLLTFQAWNWSLAAIKTWLTAHPHGQLDVGAIYTTTDGQNHNYWDNPRLTNSKRISMQKRGTQSIGNSMFQNCYSLRSLNIPSGATSIALNAFQSCYSLKSVNIPSGVTSFQQGCFNACASLERVILPDSITSLDGVTHFSYCYSLRSINIPSGATSIGSHSFFNCYSLTSIVIPSGVTSIAYNAFGSCVALNDIVIKGTPRLEDTAAFSDGSSTRRFYVPRANLSYFESATNWSSLYSSFYAIEDYTEYLASIGIDA